MDPSTSALQRESKGKKENASNYKYKYESFISQAHALGFFRFGATSKCWHVGSQQCMCYLRTHKLWLQLGIGKDFISDTHTVTCGLNQLSSNSPKAILGKTLDSS